MTIFFCSCLTRQKKENEILPLLEKCDEFQIIYYAKDTFLYKTIDTSAIKFFCEFISAENENINDTCEPTGQLIFKNKGQEIIKAEMTTVNIKDSISCQYVTYYINSQRIRQKMTYRIGMSIDQIYWGKVDPKGNPISSEADTTKFKYEAKKNNH